VSRYADDSDKFRDKGAKLLALMQTTLGGTLFVYQGEEIGMRNAPTEWDIDEEYKDIETVNYWKKARQIYKDQPDQLEHARKIIHMKARDHARTPMQWTASSANAGFCDPAVKPWMRVMDDFKAGINAKDQMDWSDKDNQLSTWQFWQRGIHDRKKHADVFVYGDFQEISPEDPSIFAYGRISQSGERWLVVLNFSGKPVEWTLPESLKVEFWACSNYVKDQPEKPLKGTIPLKPWEGLLAKCKVE